MCKVIVSVVRRIIRNGAYGLRKNGGILQVFPRQIMARCIFHDHAVLWIDYDPPLAYRDFGYHVFRIVIAGEQKQPASPQVGTPHEIQEGIGRRATDVQQLAVS